jgi:acyl carrier protein
MSSDSVFQKITPIFRDIFEDDDLLPHSSMTAADVEQWDSLNHIRLIVEIEKFFNISFTSAEVYELKNVGDFVKLIEKKTC